MSTHLWFYVYLMKSNVEENELSPIGTANHLSVWICMIEQDDPVNDYIKLALITDQSKQSD